jgi:hypothetical protein
VKLSLDPGDDAGDKFSVALREVVDQLVSVSGGKLEVTVARQPGSPHGSRPCLYVGNIHYLAVPYGPELEPFLGLLQTLANTPPGEAQQPDLDPAQVDVLMAPTCPNCPLVVGACAQLAAGRPQLQLSVIDVQYFTDLAGSVKSVPTVIVDGTYTVVGGLQTEELLQILVGRGEPDHTQRALASMLETGRFVEAVPLLADERALAALPVLLREGTIKARMGVMLLAEEALESDPHCLDGALPHLLPLLEQSDATLRGDTADLLGTIGAPGAREALTRLLEDDNPDVREVAAEALESLRQPS